MSVRSSDIIVDSEESQEQVKECFRTIVHTLFHGTNLKIEPNETTKMIIGYLTNLCTSQDRNQLFFDAVPTSTLRALFVDNLERIALEPCSSQTSPESDQTSIQGLVINLVNNLTRSPPWADFFFTSDQLLLKRAFSSSHTVELYLPTLFIDCHTQLVQTPPLLEALITPLCQSGYEIDDEDCQVLPDGVVDIIRGRRTDSTPSTPFLGDLQLTCCQALFQLCATSAGRLGLRSNGVYFILRELDKCLTAEQNSLRCQQQRESPSVQQRLREIASLIYHLQLVVDQLIVKEEELNSVAKDAYSLRSIVVDPDIAAETDRLKTTFINGSPNGDNETVQIS